MTQELRKLAEAVRDAKTHNELVLAQTKLDDSLTSRQLLELLDRLEKSEKDAAVAIGMLADWCVAVDQNGASWDDWDEHYKDAMYRPCSIREPLDEAIKAAMEASK